MLISVPKPYASYLRNRKILLTSAVVVPCLFFAFLFKDNNLHYMLIGFSGTSASSLFFLLFSKHHLLDYDINSDGITLRIQNSKSRLTGLQDATSTNWLDWRTDPLTGIEVTHWRQSPALLFKTTKYPEGKIVPFEKEDINQVWSFLENACQKQSA